MVVPVIAAGSRDAGSRIRVESLLLRSCRLIHAHTETEPHAVQDLLDFVQRLAAEVLRLEHFGFRLLNQLANRADVRVSSTGV